MIRDLRFVERKDYSGFGGGDVMIGPDGEYTQPYRTVRILQMYKDQYGWIDVPLVEEPTE